MINRAPLTNVEIFINDGSAKTKTLSTRSKSEFKVYLDYGKIYHIYFRHPSSPVMYMEVVANTVPPEKYDYLMGYECDINIVNKTDDEIDTTVFGKPFYRVIFNGGKKMIDDAAYNSAFARNMYKKKAETEVAAKDTIKSTPAREEPGIVTGKIFSDPDLKIAVKNKAVFLLDKNGKILKSTFTNRFGVFSFPGIMASEAALIKVEEIDPGTLLTLVSSKNAVVANSKASGTTVGWNLRPEEIQKLIDNNFTTIIGGKLVSSSLKEKKFFSKKDVFLSDEFNNVIKKTKTNLIGTFVFENIEPNTSYYIGVARGDVAPGEKIDLLTKDDNYITTLDSTAGDKQTVKISSSYNKVFNDISIGEEEMKMDVKATIFGDNVNTPIRKLKIILLNDNYEVIDSAFTDNFGAFKFRYLPFLKRFYLSAENGDNSLDAFKNILVYSSDNNLIKIVTHQKGTKFSYKPVSAEISRLRDIELEDPWLELIDDGTAGASGKRNITTAKSIVENIFFETGKYDVTASARPILDKIIVVLNANKRLRIEIGAHTDSKGSDASNLKLSQLRANTVQNYILSSGIDVKRIISKGYGESKLLNNCKDNQPCSEMEHAQNRRIEFKILGD